MHQQLVIPVCTLGASPWAAICCCCMLHAVATGTASAYCIPASAPDRQGQGLQGKLMRAAGSCPPQPYLASTCSYPLASAASSCCSACRHTPPHTINVPCVPSYATAAHSCSAAAYQVSSQGALQCARAPGNPCGCLLWVTKGRLTPPSVNSYSHGVHLAARTRHIAYYVSITCGRRTRMRSLPSLRTEYLAAGRVQRGDPS